MAAPEDQQETQPPAAEVPLADPGLLRGPPEEPAGIPREQQAVRAAECLPWLPSMDPDPSTVELHLGASIWRVPPACQSFS